MPSSSGHTVPPAADQGRNPFEEALGRVVARIRSGELSTGEKLPPERDLSDMLGISRSTMRAVIRGLQQAGYVSTQRGRSGGSFVIWQGDADDVSLPRHNERMKRRLLDMLRFRSVIEPGAAALAAEADLTKSQQRELQARLSAATCNGREFRLADAELHAYIAELSGCDALIESIANVQLLLNETLLQIVPMMGPALAHSHEQHAAIVDAIVSGNSRRARELMEDHVGATTELIRTFLA